MLAEKSSHMGVGAKRPLMAKGFHMNSALQQQEDTHLDAFLAAAHRRKYPAKST
jgi:hypothetical protein